MNIIGNQPKEFNSIYLSLKEFEIKMARSQLLKDIVSGVSIENVLLQLKIILSD